MQKELEVTRTFELDDLKSLADVTGPCLTLYLPVEKAPRSNRLEESRLKSVAQLAERALLDRNIKPAVVRELVDSIPHIADTREQRDGVPGNTLVVFRSPDIFRAFELAASVKEAIHAGEHLEIRPLVKSLQENKLEFYVLALSQRHVRLLRCTARESNEVPLPPDVPRDLNTWLNTLPPTSDGPLGSFTSTTDLDKKDQHLSNFYHVINKAVSEVLRDKTDPLILCGVEFELSLYRTIDTYLHTLPVGVEGSPDSLKGGELHNRALEIARESTKEPMKKALGIYEKLGGTERVSTKPKEIVAAAHQSRIAFLFADETAVLTGRYDPNSLKVIEDDKGEDLVNLAVLRTIAYGGEVFMTPAGLIPGQGPMAAIYRF